MERIQTRIVSLIYGDAINLSVTRAAAIENDPAKPLKKRLRLFGHNIASNICFTFLDYTSCSEEGGRVEAALCNQLASTHGLQQWRHV